jgi:hypothetical protein
MYRQDTTVNKGLKAITKMYEGKRQYELSNHLGNVLTVISDRRTYTISGTTKIYDAVVLSAQDYYPFGMGIDVRSFTATTTYRYGFNGQEVDDEINKNTYTAMFWEYDARIAKRWNVDPKPYAYESNYAIDRGNPIKNNDPNGDCPDCKTEARVSLNFTIGTKGQSRVNFAASIGISKTSVNFMGGANLSLNIYNGGPGTTQASTGSNSMGGAVTIGLSGTVGTGTGTATDLNVFNSTTLSGVKNNFEKSGTLATNLTYNTATGFNRAAGFAGKLGGFTVTINEDFSLLPRGGLLASGKDEGETGGGFIGYTFKNGNSILAGTEIFTGRPTQYPKKGDGKGYVLQESLKQYNLNVGRSFLKVENIQYFGNIRFDYSGQSQMWSQNLIHDIMKIDHFKSTAENSFQITR